MAEKGSVSRRREIQRKRIPNPEVYEKNDKNVLRIVKTRSTTVGT